MSRRGGISRVVYCTVAQRGRDRAAGAGQEAREQYLDSHVIPPRWLLTSTKVGHIKTWIRPLPATSQKNGQSSRVAMDGQDPDRLS
jgi:hypothetical protein